MLWERLGFEVSNNKVNCLCASFGELLKGEEMELDRVEPLFLNNDKQPSFLRLIYKNVERGTQRTAFFHIEKCSVYLSEITAEGKAVTLHGAPLIRTEKDAMPMKENALEIQPKYQNHFTASDMVKSINKKF